MQKDGTDGVDGLGGARTVAVSPDGGHVYVGGQHDDALAVFSRDATTGALTFVESIFDDLGGVDGLDHPSFITFDPDGSHVYVAATRDDGLSVFSRDAITGELTFVEVHHDGQGGVDGLGGPRGVAVSPDGAHVYATSQSEDGLSLFNRDAATGALTFVSTLKNGQLDGAGNTVDGLAGAIEVKLSSDGRHVYVTG